MEVEIDGKIYVQKEQNNKQTAKMSRMSTMLYGMAMMFSSQGSIASSKYQREFPRVNLIDEYKLIVEKKSKLSKAERDMVVNRFNKNFKLKE